MRNFFTLVLALLLFNGAVFAQGSDLETYRDSTISLDYNRFYISLNGGLTQFYGDVSSDIFFPGSMMKGKIPWAFSPRVGWDFNQRFGVRTDFNISSIWAKSNKPNQDIYFHASVFDWQGEFILNMTNIVFPHIYNKRWNITAFVGAGWMWFNTIARNSKDSILYVVGYDLNGNKTKRESDRMWNAGFSGAYKFAKHFDVSLEVKFNNTPTDKLDGVDHVLSEFDNYSTVMLGITYYFGKHEQEMKWNPMEGFFEGILDSVDAVQDSIVDLGNQVRDLKYCCEMNKPKEADDDQDSVPNSKDLEPNTPRGNLVNFQGITIPVDTAKPAAGKGGAIVGGAAVPAPGTAMYFNSIYFPFDKSVITKESYMEIVKVAQYLRAHPGTRLKISGNCDIRGSNAYNDALSLRRVKAAKKVLVEDFGFKPEDFVEEALSEYKPISNKVHWVNRRVDFIIVN